MVIDSDHTNNGYDQPAQHPFRYISQNEKFRANEILAMWRCDRSSQPQKPVAFRSCCLAYSNVLMTLKVAMGTKQDGPFKGNGVHVFCI